MDINHIYKGKKVLVTGHTGFKGSWLTIWLLEMGAEVIGYSIDNGDEKGIFQRAKLQKKIKHISGDVNDLVKLQEAFREYAPDLVFHLAAQPIVTESYEHPLETFRTNVLGTLHVLECIKNSSTQVGVIVTSDKCYKNKDIRYSYKEDDEMGGKDPYSASKGCAEIITHSYINSFFQQQHKMVASVRAGNMLGGGDWAKDRIIPDSIRALQSRSSVFIRNPSFVRPWQHVLDPLHGYLLVGAKLLSGEKQAVGGWNFGPQSKEEVNVQKLVERVIHYFGAGEATLNQNFSDGKESPLLSLDCSKAERQIGWRPRLDIEKTIKLTVDWYKNYEESDVYYLCKEHLNFFTAQREA